MTSFCLSICSRGQNVKLYHHGYHFHAGATQLSFSLDPLDTPSIINNCLSNLVDLMAANILKFKDGKTELIIIGKLERSAKSVNLSSYQAMLQ